MTLDPKVVEQAAGALSRAGKFWFTRRCLMFELCRRGAWTDPGKYESGLDGCERDFAAALAEHELRAGQLARLVRPEAAIAGIEPADLQAQALPGDLFDYAIQRVALFQRMDLCLMLIANGFHREIELALTVPPEFPTHVWARIRAQLDAGLRTTFLAVHDCGAASEAWVAAIEAEFESYDCVEVARVGLTVPWAFRLKIPVRGPAPDGAGSSDKPPSYALLEELTPLRAMRWIYGRVSRGAEDTGFG